MPRRYLIVGMGAAGVAAAETIRNQDATGEIVILSDDPHGYYSRPGLAYYLTGEVTERLLHPFSHHDFRRLNLRHVYAHATRLDLTGHQVETDRKQSLSYDRLLLATGSQAVDPTVPGIDLQGVVKLDHMDDARGILKLSRRSHVAVVVGGGITALEIVEGLKARGVQVHYFLRRDRYWSNVLDPTESQWIEHRLQEEGIQLHHNTEMVEIRGKRGRVVGVTTGDGHEISCGLVAVAVGVQPRMELATQAGLRTNRGILVDEYMQASSPDVYAAGDVAQAFDPFSGKALLNTLWGVAVSQGRTAGLNMTGQSQPYHPGVPLNVTRLAWLPTIIIGTVGRGRDADVPGLVRGDSEGWRQLTEASQGAGPITVQAGTGPGGTPGADGNRLRLIVGEKSLLGAVIMGDQTISRALYYLIGKQVDITPIRDRLLQSFAKPEEILTDFWNEWRRQDAAQES
jgi:nitrite reductase (NADH) large subunit